jgi:hypothetical protein
VPQTAAPKPEDLIKDLLDEERFKQRRADELAQIEEKRGRDIESGREFVKDFSLGRITETPLAAQNEKLRALLEGRLGGLGAGEGAALREQAFRGLGQQTQGDIRALRGIQGAQGVTGPAAVAQQQNVFSQAADRGSDLEQQLLLRNLDIQRQAAGDFGSEIARQQGQQLGINQFNIGQSNQEAAIRNAFPFLFANLGAQEQATATGAITGRDALLASLFPDLLQGQGAGAPPPQDPQSINRSQAFGEAAAIGVNPTTGFSKVAFDALMGKQPSLGGVPISTKSAGDFFSVGG